MNRKATALIATALSGCIMSPAEVMDQGKRFEMTTTKPPAAAAECIYSNTELKNARRGTTIRPGPDGSTHVYVRTAGEIVTTMGVIELRPEGTGSKATVWMSILVIGDLKEVANQFLEGC